MLKKITTRIMIIAALLVIAQLLVQFVILSAVGTTGPELSRLRSEREQIELDNKVKLAQISELRTSDKVFATATANLDMQPGSVDFLQDPDQQVYAIVK